MMLIRLMLFALVVLAPRFSAGEEPVSPNLMVREGPITRWDEAMPLGDGLMGALVWGEGHTLHVSLDRNDLWDERIPDALAAPDWTYATMVRLKQAKDHASHVRMFDAPYDTIAYPTKLPAGRLEMEFPEDVQIRRFELDMRRGELLVEHSKGRVKAAIYHVLPLLILRCEGPKPQLRLMRPKGLDALGYDAAVEKTLPEGPLFTQAIKGGGAFGVRCAFRNDQGKQEVHVTISLAEDVTSAEKMSLDQIDGLSDHKHSYPMSLRSITSENAVFWDAAWASSSVKIPDIRLLRQYNMCKYLYIAGSRPDAPPMPLQGVWTADEGGLPPWKGDYHNDLNTQMTYLAYHAAGLRDQGLSFANFNWNLLDQYRAFARSFYGLSQGAVVPGVMSLAGKPLGGWGQYSLSPTHSAWIGQTFYLHWKYTMDASFLKTKAYPWCAEVGTALEGLLKPGADGMLELPLSTSPEMFDNSYEAWLTPNSNYDLALMRFLFSANAEMADAAGKADDVAKWKTLLTKLAGLDINPATHALTVAKGVGFSQSHRHFSHAMAIYPLRLLNPEDAKDRVTIDATMDEIESRGTSQWCGYSFAWFSAMSASVGQADRALRYLRDYERAFTGPNGFHLNGDQTKSGLSSFTYRPFTLEGNFLAMQAVHEMLLQSRGGTLRVFAATPGEWADASFRDLRAQGGWRVSAERKGGRTVKVVIRAGVDGTLRLADPFGGAATVWEGVQPRLVEGVWEASIKRGEQVEGRLP